MEVAPRSSISIVTVPIYQLSNLSQTTSTPTCASKGTVDYTGSYDSWGNTASQLRGGITRTLKYDGLDHLVRWSSSVNSQEEWNLYDASGERVLRRTYDGTNTVITVFAFGVEEHAYSYSATRIIIFWLDGRWDVGWYLAGLADHEFSVDRYVGQCGLQL